MKSNGSHWFQSIWHNIRNRSSSQNKAAYNANASTHTNYQQHNGYNQTNSSKEWFSSGSRYAVDFFSTFCVVYTVTQLGIGYSICVGPSMLPTLDKDGQIVLIDKFSYRMLGADYKVGDVVVSKAKEDPGKSVCKRIRATPGDVVINRANGTLMVIPEGHVWLAGDNTYNSSDSRMYGPMPIGMLQGRVFFKFGLYPLHATSIDNIVLHDKYDGMKYEQQDPNKQCFFVSKDRNLMVNNYDINGDQQRSDHHQLSPPHNYVQNSIRNRINSNNTIIQYKDVSMMNNDNSSNSGSRIKNESTSSSNSGSDDEGVIDDSEKKAES